MSTPVNRMSEHFLEVAEKSTIDYIEYCWKRLYPSDGVTLHCQDHPVNGQFRCRFSAINNHQAFIVCFNVPVEAGGAEIKEICNEAADALDNIVLRIAT